jgi:hypothetical protein
MFRGMFRHLWASSSNVLFREISCLWFSLIAKYTEICISIWQFLSLAFGSDVQITLLILINDLLVHKFQDWWLRPNLCFITFKGTTVKIYLDCIRPAKLCNAFLKFYPGICYRTGFISSRPAENRWRRREIYFSEVKGSNSKETMRKMTEKTPQLWV